MSTSLIRLACPACAKRLKLLPTERAEGKIVCPRCGHSFLFEHPDRTDTQAEVPVVRSSSVVQPVQPSRMRSVLALFAALLTATLLIGGVTFGLTWLLTPAPEQVVSATPAEPASSESVPAPIPASSTTPQQPQPRPVEPPWLPPEKQQQVQEAMVRGRNYLLSQQRENGTFADGHPLGVAALAGLSLLESGLPANHSGIQKVAGFVRQEAATYRKYSDTYELSLALLFLDRLGEKGDRPLIRSLAMRLVASQQADGGWSYRDLRLNEAELPALMDFLSRTRERFILRSQASKDRAAAVRVEKGKEIRRVHAELPRRVQEVPAVRTALLEETPRLNPTNSDNSNTQFALLALWAARRQDLPVERSLRLVVQRFRQSQNEDGGWGYFMHGGGGTPAMIGVGLLGLAVGHGLTEVDPAASPERDPHIDRALEALSRHIGQSTGSVNLYFLWTLERVGVLYKLRQIHGKEWYPWGAEELLKPETQWLLAQGAYHGSTELIDTCFALLFLSRANFTSDLSDRLERVIRVRER